MAIRHSRFGSGVGVPAVNHQAGAVQAQLEKYTNVQALAANDFVGFAVLPAYHNLHDLKLDAAGFTIGNVGIMSGGVGADKNDDGTDRTMSATNLVTAGVLNAAGRAVVAVDFDREIAFQQTAGLAAGAGTLVSTMLYSQNPT